MQRPVSIHNRFRVFRRIVIAVLVLMVTLLSIAIFGSMDDLVRGDGRVEGIREYDLKSLVNARVVKIHHHEGESVSPGAVLLEFDARDQHDRIRVLENRVAELTQSIRVKEKELALLRRDPLPAYYRHTGLQLDEARERLVRSEHELKVYDDLFKRRVITRREHLRVELEHLGNKMAVQRLEEDWGKLRDGMSEQILERAGEELNLLRRQLRSRQDELAMARQHLEDYLLRAPDAGILTDIPPRPGGYYERGEVVVRFSADQNKKVIALIDEKQIFKVEPGQRVRIYCRQYNYLDYGYFEGRVELIYQLPVESGGINYYPVKIVLVNERQPLRFGSSCEVAIITGRERIIFALLGIRSEEFLRRQIALRTGAAKKPSPEYAPAAQKNPAAENAPPPEKGSSPGTTASTP